MKDERGESKKVMFENFLDSFPRKKNRKTYKIYIYNMLKLIDYMTRNVICTQTVNGTIRSFCGLETSGT